MTIPVQKPLAAKDTLIFRKTKKNQVVTAISCSNHLIWWANTWKPTSP
jgi:hypothetical protein